MLQVKPKRILHQPHRNVQETFLNFSVLSGIVKIFKGESCYTYYTPFTCKNGVRIQASGKLWDHYNYIKGDLRKQGILLQRSISKPIQETYAQTEIDEDKLQWLFQHTEPWEQVYEYCNNTYRARNKLLMQDKLNVLEYFNKFPCLRLNKGQHLEFRCYKMRRNERNVNDQKFKVDSCLQAIELTFKIFFAVDCKYPTYAETLWIFLQKSGFDIHLQEKCNNSLNVMLGRVNAEMERLLAT
ncbi:uncharacterized protein [Temnothorax nylanderi]|uniref:uncharacterized protein n=1 Tax=Temnothorax nylanderi TaxID=102681 RepID=UPI003A8C2574